MSQTIRHEPAWFRRSSHYRRAVDLLRGLATCSLLLLLAGCSQAVQSAAPAATQPSATSSAQTSQPAVELNPTSGYAGTFVTVRGADWPPSTLVTIKLADTQGSTPVLAASTTNANGEFSTGFIYPIGERWLQPGAQKLIVAAEDQSTQVEPLFTVAPPEGVTPPTPSPGPTMPPPAATTGVTPVMPVTPFTPVAGQTPTVTVQPSTGGIGTPVTISGTGFPAVARLTVYLTDGDPTGDPKAGHYSYVTTSSNEAGEYRLTLNIPGSWPDGTPLDARRLAIIV
ncbi:MAG TPA: hypothetical protein PKE45_02415, partial [Caldilineaceae bacterium]|nr:hypothetical protein [Caldilineaceae bacterium]